MAYNTSSIAFIWPNVGVQRLPKAVRRNGGIARTRHTTSHNIRIHAGFDAEARIAGMESSMMPLCMYCCAASRAAIRIARSASSD